METGNDNILVISSFFMFSLYLQQEIIDGVLDEADGRSIDELAHDRDQMLFGLIAVRDRQGRPGSPGA